MNKKNLVLQISNHPIIELLKKNRTISNKTIARLIVEEMMSEEEEKPVQMELPFESEEEEKPEYVRLFPNDKPIKSFYETFKITSDNVGLTNLQMQDLVILISKLLTTVKQDNSNSFKKHNIAEEDSGFTPFNNQIESAKIASKAFNTEEFNSIISFLSTYSTNKDNAKKWLSSFQEKLQNLITRTAEEKPAEEPTEEPAEEPSSEPAEEPAKEPSSEPAEEPAEEPRGEETSDSETFDPEAEDLETLITTSKALIDEFYDKEFLQEQGILINDVLKQLAKIVEKEEQEKAAKRSKKSEQPGQELQEQDQEPFNKKERRNIQIDLKSFLRLIKKAKAVLKKFDDLRNKGSIASSGYKKDFIKILVQLQGNIKTLVEDLTPYMNLTEAVEKSDLQKKWDAIEAGYEKATGYLSNIIQAGTETQENFDMENNVKGAYGALMGITGYFPSVNPFGAKTTSGFDEYESKFSEAVDEVKGTIRDILEVTKGTI